MQDEEDESAMLRKTNLNSGHKFQLRGRSESLTNVAFENLMHLKKKSFTFFLLLALCVTSTLFLLLAGSIYLIKRKRVIKNKKSVVQKV